MFDLAHACRICTLTCVYCEDIFIARAGADTKAPCLPTLRQGGEDLRGDQRVEQLFDVMNGLLAHHPAAQAADLKARGSQQAPCPA